MAIKSTALKITVLLLFCICGSIAESADPSWVYCNDATSTNDQQTLSNRDDLLDKLVSTAITQDGYSTAFLGNGKNRVYGLAQCRGDVSKDVCSVCIKDAAKTIRERCPTQGDSRIWYEYCTLRYNTKKFFGEVDTSNGLIYYNVENVSDPKQFNKELGELFGKIRKEAVAPANKGLGKGKTELTSLTTLYGLVQCTRDLDQLSCAQCAAIATGNFETICKDKKGCRVIYSSCFIRYELYPFYFPLDPQKTSGNAPAKYGSFTVSKN